MKHVSSHSSWQDESPTLPARFAFSGELGDLLLSHLQKDAREARLSAKFRLFYRIRHLIPIWLRQLLQKQRNQNMDVPDRWYLPQQFASEFSRVLDSQDLAAPLLHPWPDNFGMACVLTHDVETQEGMDTALELARIEEEFGFRSCWNLIPYKYEIDSAITSELKWRGHEIGIHGFNHDGRLFESSRTFGKRVSGINAALRKYDCAGFRTPMVHRNLLWQQQLEVDYDASCFDIDPFQAMPGGVGACWPFFAGRFVELPYTLPQDHTLLVALGETTPNIWIEKFHWLSRMHGMALLVTHPDYLVTQEHRDIYRRFLAFVAEQQEDCWMALPGEVSTWWRQRDGLEVITENDMTTIAGSSSNRASLTTLSDLFPHLISSFDKTRSELDSHC